MQECSVVTLCTLYASTDQRQRAPPAKSQQSHQERQHIPTGPPSLPLDPISCRLVSSAVRCRLPAATLRLPSPTTSSWLPPPTPDWRSPAHLRSRRDPESRPLPGPEPKHTKGPSVQRTTHTVSQSEGRDLISQLAIPKPSILIIVPTVFFKLFPRKQVPDPILSKGAKKCLLICYILTLDQAVNQEMHLCK